MTTAEQQNVEMKAEEKVENDLFQDISPDNQFYELESLCMNCGENGTTRLLLTRIPFFKEIILMAFNCPHCGFNNNEIQPGGAIQEKGVKFVLKVTSRSVNIPLFSSIIHDF